MRLIPFSIAFLLCGYFSFGQPSQNISFYFKLFDDQGKPVNYEHFCADYKFSLMGLTACTNKHMSKSYTYSEATQYFNGSGSVVYNDLERIFVHEKDTMTLILLTDGGKRTEYRIDSLYVKPGKYVVEDPNSNSIDFEKAEIAYYNWLLKHVLHIRKQIYNYQNNSQYIELNKLKCKYKIDSEDNSKKAKLY
ncbi:hypothetical protein [Flavobacterium sp. SM2513]|uniref:hypothetical protein n=1 Tax=Flavobacterium sp. SM2513 TaxID=3424766 RepID=UPI003D7FCA5C